MPPVTLSKGIKSDWAVGESWKSTGGDANWRLINDWLIEQWGQDTANTSGLSYAYKGGVAISSAGVVSEVGDGTVTLTNGATNYVERTAAGVVSKNTSGFTTGQLPMAKVVTSGGEITSVTDRRVFAYQVPSSSGIPASTVDAKGDLIAGTADDTVARLAVGANGKALLAASGETTGLIWGYLTESLAIACSDETTALTTGTAKVTFRMPYAFTLSAVRASVTTAPTGSTLIVDINEAGSTILSTKLSIDASEKTSVTAASAAVISDSSLADDAEITIDFDQVGSTVAGAGLKVYLIGTRA